MSHLTRGISIGVLGLGLCVGAPATGWADPGEVTVECSVYAQLFFDDDFPSFAGTVRGTGSDYAAAVDDANHKKWGPYGGMPSLRGCHVV